MPCRNVGGIDRAVRLALGVVLLATALVLATSGHAHGAWTVGIIGALVLASGALAFCPPYVLLGISTANRGRARAQGEAVKRSRAG